MKRTVQIKDQNGETLIDLTIEGQVMDDIRESARRWCLGHNSICKDITKQAYGFEIEGEVYEEVE